MTTPTVTTPITPVTAFDLSGWQQRCSSVLRPINGMAEDGEWHCHLPHGHDDVCLAADGTTW